MTTIDAMSSRSTSASDETFAAMLGERFEDRAGELVGALVEHRPLGPSGIGARGGPYPPVRTDLVGRPDGDEPFAFRGCAAAG